MPAAPAKTSSVDAFTLESIAGQLACPVCIGALRIDGPGLLCADCGRSYPIVDGIPVLLEERAQAPSQAVSSGASSTSVPERRTE